MCIVVGIVVTALGVMGFDEAHTLAHRSGVATGTVIERPRSFAPTRPSSSPTSAALWLEKRGESPKIPRSVTKFRSSTTARTRPSCRVPTGATAVVDPAVLRERSARHRRRRGQLARTPAHYQAEGPVQRLTPTPLTRSCGCCSGRHHAFAPPSASNDASRRANPRTRLHSHRPGSDRNFGQRCQPWASVSRESAVSGFDSVAKSASRHAEGACPKFHATRARSLRPRTRQDRVSPGD
jgi:hypothetical protein